MRAAQSPGGRMADSGELVYVYDNSPPSPSEPPVKPEPPVNPLTGPGARSRPPRPPSDPRGWSFRWRNPRLARKLGDGLVFLTAADRDLIGSPVERTRYITMAVLMVITAAQAWYTGTTFMSISLSQPFLSDAGFGLFFAAAVFFIDRSIIGFAAPFNLRPGTGTLASPKKTSAALFIRIGVAVVVALLMSETLLLRVFADDINQQILANHLVAQKADVAGNTDIYAPQIAPLQAQINAATKTVSSDEANVATSQHAAQCQQTGGAGCDGVPAGEGPAWEQDEKELTAAQNALSAAQAALASDTSTANPDSDQSQINRLESAERKAISNDDGTINQANKLLSREEAFWQLTVEHGAVAATRLLLSLLLLGIDLAPLLTKLTGRTSVHDKRAYEADYDTHHKIEERGKATRDQREARGQHDRELSALALADELAAADRDSALARFRTEANVDAVRARTAADTEVALAREEARVDLERYKIMLDAEQRKSRLYRDYQASMLPPEADSPPGGGHGHPDGNGHADGNGGRLRRGWLGGNGGAGAIGAMTQTITTWPSSASQPRRAARSPWGTFLSLERLTSASQRHQPRRNGGPGARQR